MSEDEKQSVPDILAEIVEEVCNKYCKYGPTSPEDENCWNPICEDCPLLRLL